MRRSLRGLAALVVAASPLVACSLLVDTEGLSGGASESESGAEATTTDGPSGDSLPPIDASTDAPLDAPDGAAKCVDGPNRFCDDFDSPAPGSKWSDSSKKRGEVTFEDVGLSPPRAMHATIMTGGGNAEAQLIKELTGSPTTVHCELDMKLDSLQTTGETDVIAFLTGTGGVELHNVYFASFSGVWNLAEYADPVDGGPTLDRMISLGAALPNATWFHVVLDVSPTFATITANGNFIKLEGLTTPTGAKHSVQVGVTFTTTDVQSGGVFVDNVDCTWPP